MPQRLRQRQYIVTRADPGLVGYPTFKRLHGKMRPQLGGLPGLQPASAGYLTYHVNAKLKKIRVYVDRRVTRVSG